MSVYLGIDIGGTKIACAIVSDSGEVVHTLQVPTEAQLGGGQVLDSALNLASQLMGMTTNRISGIGIGAGGQIDPESGVVVSATEILPGWAGTDIAGAFGTRFGLPVSVDNDVNALASGEAMFGTAKGLNTAVFLALGTGVGGAVLINGKIHHGAHFSGGEIGQMIIDIAADSRRDQGGAHGTLEAYCCGSGLLKTYLKIGGPVQQSKLHPKDVGLAALSDPESKAADAVRLTGEYLGIGLVNIANIIDPDTIVIGGGLASLGDLLLAPAIKTLRSRALPGPSQCSVNLAALGEHASVIGAASLAIGRENRGTIRGISQERSSA
jgi:glucokinase